MTERINTTAASLEGVLWTPAGPFSIQVQFAKADSAAKIEVQARVDALAPWASMLLITAGSQPFAHCPYKPVGDVRVVVYGNTAGETVKVWSVE